jgi:hypothetical protein
MTSAKRRFTLPYEPEYTAHREVRRQRRNARLLQHLHMNALHESPSIAPDLPEETKLFPALPPPSRQGSR